MSRYVDADAIIENKWQVENEACFYALEDVVSVTDIEEAPSIDIVFCEDCRECVEKGTGADCPSGYGYLYCRRKKSVVNEDDYCSWGERR